MMQHSNLFQGIAIATHRGQPDGLADTVMLTPAGRASKPVWVERKSQSLYVQLTSEIAIPGVSWDIAELSPPYTATDS